MVTRIDHLVVIAGAQAAGKTTFIQDLLARRLPRQVATHLPVVGDGWRVHGAEDIAAIEESAARGTRLLLHYDLMRWLKFKGFARDPVLRFLEHAKQVTVVNLRPSAARLAKQHGVGHLRLAEGRETQRPVPGISPSWLFVRTVGHLPSKFREGLLRQDVVARRRAEFRATFQSRQWEIFQAYGRSDWIDQLHNDWKDHIRAVAAGRARILDLRPKIRWPRARFRWAVGRDITIVGADAAKTALKRI